MPPKRAQHFVPQFYLRRFASDQPTSRRIGVYLIERKRHVGGASIRNQCAEPYFYGRDGVVEDVLGELEGDAAAAIRTMVEQEQVPALGTEERAAFLRFLVLQAGRTPRSIHFMQAKLNQIAKTVLGTHPDPPSGWRDELAATELRYADPVAASLNTWYPRAPVLLDLKLSLLRNRTPHEFITSDAPVVLHNHWARRTRRGTIGLMCRGLQVILPLSPKYVALLFDGEIYEPADQGIGEVVDVVHAEDVSSLNALQVSWAYKNLYYSSGGTAAEVDALPHDLWRPLEQQSETSSYPHPTEEHRHLIVSTDHPAGVDLSLRSIGIRYEAAVVPHRDRAICWRPHAHAIWNHLKAKEECRARRRT